MVKVRHAVIRPEHVVDTHALRKRNNHSGLTKDSRNRAEYCFEEVLFRRRELTEFCGKLGEFCEKLGEFAFAHE